MGNVELLRIDKIELDEVAGVGDVEIRVDDPAITVRWHEDWDNSATRDTIEVNLANGSCSHEYYYEDNFKAKSDQVADRGQTLTTLRNVVEHLGRSPLEDHNRAGGLLRKAIAVLSGEQTGAGSAT